MNKTYDEIISVVRGDINNLEESITGDDFLSVSVLKPLISAPGKRIRSALAFLFLRAYGLDITPEQLILQCAVELAHTASLIHDDVIDLGEKRRGTDTINSIYGDKYAILAGDFILSIALKKLVSLENSVITNDFLNVFSEMAKGEISQINSKNVIPEMEEYLTKTQQKTAGLFAVSLKSAAILANRGDLAQRWWNFGFNFGTAFQIKNDLKDLEIDIKNGIYTAPVIFAKSAEYIPDDAINKTIHRINYYLLHLESTDLPENKFSDAIKEILELYKNA